MMALWLISIAALALPWKQYGHWPADIIGPWGLFPIPTQQG